MIFKIDLEKAYDKVNWSFLKNVMLKMNFPTKLIELIMFCLHSTSLFVLWNGRIMENFKPMRGLWQGDPLSPYLFMLCMEKLSQCIEYSIQKS